MEDNMTYYLEAYTIVEGAIGENEYFENGEGFDEWMEKTEAAALEDGLETQVYVIDHPHDMDMEDCCCVQYLTDHSPYCTFNDMEWPPVDIGRPD
jgi:hypothetical protein